jgi:hypothetical protein
MQFQKPFSIFRNTRINYNHWLRWDYSGQLLYQQVNMNTHAVFKNNWQNGTGVTWNPYDVSNTSLRGAGSLRRPDGLGWSYYIVSDSRKKLYGEIDLFSFWGFRNTMRVKNAQLTLVYVPINAFNISVGTVYESYWRRQDQFVTNTSFNNTPRTVVAQVDQQTLSFTARLNYNVTPDLTIQFYGQPFLTRPLYDHFAYVTDALNKDYTKRFTRFAANQLSYNNGLYRVDENMDGVVDYTFEKPDFNFVQFRSNLIIRWEYRPGSELFLVWSDGNTADAFNDLDRPVFKSLTDNAFSGNARNSFLIKWTYRFLK